MASLVANGKLNMGQLNQCCVEVNFCHQVQLALDNESGKSLLMTSMALCFAVALSQGDHRPIKVVGQQHTLVLFADGTITAWGMYRNGEIGPIASIKKGQFKSAAPVSIKLPKRAIDVAAGDWCSFALLEDGTVAAWGLNQSNMLGTEGSNSEVPVIIPGLTEVVKIAAGGQTALAVRKDGTLMGWGRNLDRTKPAMIEGPANVKDVSVADTHSLILDSSGSVWTFGNPLYGSLGRMENPAVASKMSSLSGVVSVAAGLGVSTVVKRDGTVWVWGSNFQGQFGNGDRTNAPVYGGLSNKIQLTPVQVPGVRNAASVSSGSMGRHTLALLRDGTLRGWGNTDWGQLGGGVAGTFQNSVMTPKISGVKAVFAAGNNSFAIKQDGSLWGWGIADKDSFPFFKKSTSTPVQISIR